MDRSTLQQKLNQPYTTENWREIVQHVFPNVQIFSPPQVIPVNNDKVEIFRQLGNVTLQDGKTLALFELKLKPNVNIMRNRVELNTIVSQYIDQERTHGVLSIFEQGTDDYRFTFSARATEYDEESGDFNTKKTDTKRYTYVLGRNESCKTPAARFADLADKKAQTNIQSIQDAFSVEKLSKEFFKEYKLHYLKLVDYLLATDAYKRGIFKGDEKAVRDFVKLMMGRLVFIQFVQKKRWMGVPADVPGWHGGAVNFLYQGFQDFEHKETFYSSFLEPLFYDTLNTPDRVGDIFHVTGTKVPYLNGGLFEDGDIDTSLINFPETYFADLLEFFDRYNFTIDENDPNEHEVGIDPEMLGHIFENLLEDNKDKGAFYTPKEIVHYMCQESLKEYLKTQLESKGVWPVASDQATEMEQSLEAFVKRKEAADIIDHDGILALALRDVKICDPAIGSGAFPMGLLNEIFRCVFVLHDASPDTVGEIWGMETWQPETVKKNIIQNSIYGVDIERGAVDIARLRFWLSLIVDEPEPHALPNLDYKIVVGNSLVSKLDDDIIDIDWEIKNGTQSNAFGIANVERRKVLLQAICSKQKVYFDPTCDKDVIGHEIRDLKIDLLINQLEEMINTQGVESRPTGNGRAIAKQTVRYLETVGWKQSITKLQAIKNDQDAHLHFFDWKLDFPEVMNEQVTENVGFDIVIGNPPYIKGDSIGNIKSIYKDKYITYSGNADLYIYFIESGINMLNKSGVLAYITPNKWIESNYGTNLRKLIYKNRLLIEFLDFGELPIFKSASTFPSILLLKSAGSESFTYYEFSNLESFNNFYKETYNQNELARDRWTFASEREIIKEIERNHPQFKEIFKGNLLAGIKTGANSILIIDKKDLPVGGENLFKRILFGKNLNPYKIKESESFVFFPYEFKNGKNSLLDLKLFTNTYNYFLNFKEQLISRAIIKEGVIKGNKEWYELQQININFDYNESKIIYPDISSKNKFVYDESGIIPDMTCFFIPTKQIEYVPIFNSTIFRFLAANFCPVLGNFKDGGRIRYKSTYMENIPLPKLSEGYKTNFGLLSMILHYLGNSNKCEIFERVSDALAFNLYLSSHMEEKAINVDNLINRDINEIIKDIDFKTIEDNQKNLLIDGLYKRWSDQSSEINSRINLFKNESPNIIKPILGS